MDAEKGEGVDVARRYHVKGFPTFILVNADGDVLDRWMGYEDVPKLLETMDVALDDPITVDARVRRFRSEPTGDDAKRLADIRYYSGFYGDAVGYYKRAEALSADSDTNWDQHVFDALADGALYSGLYTADEVGEVADAAMRADGRTPDNVLHIARVMMRLARGDADRFVPYLSRAIEETDGVADAEATRARLLPDYALHVTKDVEAAVAYKKATLDEGWMDSSGELNNFAWWCFENEVNLDEAEEMARKGVELAEPGTERANVLDTLAELCNLKGDCREALELIRQALEENPSSDYLKNQLARFEEILKEQEQKG